MLSALISHLVMCFGPASGREKHNALELEVNFRMSFVCPSFFLKRFIDSLGIRIRYSSFFGSLFDSQPFWVDQSAEFFSLVVGEQYVLLDHYYYVFALRLYCL